MPSLELDARAGMPDFEARLVGRRHSAKRGVVGISQTGARVEIHFREDKLRIVVERFQTRNEPALKIPARIREIPIGIADVIGDRVERGVVFSGYAGVEIELGE